MKEFKRSRNALLHQWEELLRLRRIALKSCGQEDIHDLRVASRRFRAALSLLGPICSGGNPQKLTKAVRRLTRELGFLRNLDEALQFFGTHADHAALSGLLSRLAEKRECEQRRCIKALKCFKPEKIDSLVCKLATGVKKTAIQKTGMPTLPAYLTATAANWFGGVRALLPSALSPEGGEDRHALRIAFKKLRYFLEIVSRIMERDYDVILDQLKRYQTLLGSMNDMQEFGLLCRKTAGSPDELAVAERILTLENDRLFNEFVMLVEAEPLDCNFPV